MKNRIRKIRSELDLTQQAFAEKIGIKRNTIANYETGRNEPVDSVISLICREFNVNESWLRYGEGEMFKPAPSDTLDQLAYEYNLSNAAYIAVEKFVNMNPTKRNELLEFFIDVSKAIINSETDINTLAFPANVPIHSTPNTEMNNTSIEKTTAELEEEYKKSASNSAQKTNSSASHTTKDIAIEQTSKKRA